LEPTIVERADHPISRRDIDPNVLKVLYRLIGAGHRAYLVGGGVRDLMVGRQPKDFDVATSAHPNQVRELFRNSRLIGRRFRLVHVFFGPNNLEVATFRRRSDELVDSGDPLIRHDNSFGTAEEDAFRRDFTINGLFYDPGSFQVIDYVEGVADLRARLIRAIGDPELRMREDPVRMIRAVRFAVKLGFAIEPATRAAIEQNRCDLAKASIPRLVEETYRTLSIPQADSALVLLHQLGLLELLLPFLAQELYGQWLADAPVVRNLAAMGQAMAGQGAAESATRGQGQEPQEFSRPFILALLFADFHLTRPRNQTREELAALVAALRARGYSKADTEQMRLLLDALTHITTRSRTLRRIMRRPYFADARRLFELIAPAAVSDPVALEDFLAGPPRAATATAPPARGRRRRRRRGGRGRRPKPMILATSTIAAAPDGESPGAIATIDNTAGAAASAETIPVKITEGE